MIISPTINKCDNPLLDQLSQIMAMKFNMLHLIMCNRIISKLDCILTIIVKKSQGFVRKHELTQKLLAPKALSANTKNTMIVCFSHR